MRKNYRTIRIFAESELRDYLEQWRQSAIDSIENEKDDYLLNVNESDYIKYRTEEALIDPLEIHEDQIYVSSSEQMIPAECFPGNYNVYSGKSYKEDVIKFHIPFSGDADLLMCSPSRGILWTMEVGISEQEFTFEIIDFSKNSKSIASKKDSNMQRIMRQYGNISTEVQRYNLGIETQIKEAFKTRKQRIRAKNNLLASLGVPIKKTDNVSSTFSIPSPKKRKKPVVNRPVVVDSDYIPEPCLDKTAYFDILKLIHDVGKEFERLPSLYAGKEEEHLRDHFLMMLEPNFEGSATGETFNNTGKTDILLRHESSNVFIAECKFWHGQKAFLDTISQLLGYLTWRDSKAAIIMFVRNKDFSSVLKTAKEAIVEHQNYIEYISSNDETWLNYKFHLNGDRNRLVNVAVMLYHIPK